MPNNTETSSVLNLTRAESSFHSENEELYELPDKETYLGNEETIIPEENIMDMSDKLDVSKVSREKTTQS